MLSKDILMKVLHHSLKTGGDFAEIYMEDVDLCSMSMIDKKLERMNIGRSRGLGLRIYKGFNSVYTFTNDTSMFNLVEMASHAAASLGNVNNSLCVDINMREKIIDNNHEIMIIPSSVEVTTRKKLLEDLSLCAYSYSNEIKQCVCSYTFSDKKILIANSEGLITNDRRVRSRLSIEAIAQMNMDKQSGSENVGKLMGYEMIHKEVDIEKMANSAAKSAVKMLHSDYCKAGVMPVVIGSGFGGVIFHEACGHSLEATSVAKGNSVFAGKIGEKIANDCVSAADNATIANSWGSYNIDDEGTDARNNLLIENGVLKSYMVDRLNGRRMRMKSTGNARRQSYKYAPTSRMSNTYILPGDGNLKDMISSIDNGLYAEKMGGGSVNPMTGEFNFSVSEGYIIKNGKLDKSVRGASLIGRGEEILKEISMVGSDIELAAGMCGSVSGSVPVCVGQASIKVDNITVGGK